MNRSLLATIAAVIAFSGFSILEQPVKDPPLGKTEKDQVFTQWVKVSDADTDLSKMPTSGWIDFVHPGAWISNAQSRSAYYKGSFDWDGKGVVKIRFGAVNFRARLWINGKSAGMHIGGYLPFEFDLTGLAKSGKNDVVLGATDLSAAFKPGAYTEFTPKDQYKEKSILYPIGSTGQLSGLILPAEIVKLPDAFIDRMWTKTFVEAKKMALRVDLLAPHTERQNGCQVSAWVEELDGTAVQAFPPVTADITKDGGKAEFEIDWPTPKLWSPENPNLYRCVATLSKNGKEIQRKSVVFGFREFVTKMGDLYLNGKKIVLRSVSKHYQAQAKQPLPADYAKSVIENAKALNANCLRLHANPYPEVFLEEADRRGLLIVNESAAWTFGAIYDLESGQFWNNLRRAWDDHILRDYNHPCWVIASVENELLLTGGSRRKGVKEELAKLGKYVKEMSGRLIMFEGDDDPNGAADIVNLHYPYEPYDHFTYPQDAYFLSDKFQAGSYPGTKDYSWNRAKPLSIGEFLWLPENIHTPAVTEGDAGYEDITIGRYRQKERLFQMYIQAFREQGVEIFNPWNPLEDYKPIVPEQIVPLAVKNAFEPVRSFVREWDTSFYEGTTVQRTITTQNYSETARNLTVSSNFDGREQKWTLPYQPCDSLRKTLELVMPSTSAIKDFPWTLKVSDGDRVLFTQTIQMTVSPKAFTGKKFTLFGNQFASDSFKSAGLDFTLATRIEDVKANPVVVAPDTLKSGEFEKLVSKGIRPIVLYPQKNMPEAGYISDYTGRNGTKQALDFTTMTWSRTVGDFKKDLVTRYFTGDNIVALGGFRLLPSLPVLPVAQAGTGHGPVTVALELPGKAVLTTVPILQKITSEPRCRQILNALLSIQLVPQTRQVYTASDDSKEFIGTTGFETGKASGLNYVSGQDVLKADMASIKKTFTDPKSLTIVDRPLKADAKLADLLKAFDSTMVLSLPNAKIAKGLTLTDQPEIAGVSRGDIALATAFLYDWRKGVVVPLSTLSAQVTKAYSYKYLANQDMVLFKNSKGARLILNLIEWDRSTPSPLEAILINAGAKTVQASILTLSNWATQGNVSASLESISFLGNGKATSGFTLPKDADCQIIFTAWQTKAGTENAICKISVDGKEIIKKPVENVSPKILGVKAKLSKGAHKITFEFTNDYYKLPEDRNLHIGSAFIRF